MLSWPFIGFSLQRYIIYAIDYTFFLFSFGLLQNFDYLCHRKGEKSAFMTDDKTSAEAPSQTLLEINNKRLLLFGNTLRISQIQKN